MAIINSVIAGGGAPAPTGTMYIISNGTYNVADKAIANVNVPTTAPAHYIEKGVDATGKLGGGTNVINLAGVTDIGAYAFAYSYYGGSLPANTNVDMSSLTKVSGANGCGYAFQECTGLTSVDLSSLTTISGTWGCAYMFKGCVSLASVDLSSLTTVGYTGCAYMFSGCTGLTSAGLSSLTTVSGQNCCDYMFNGCTSLTSIDLSSLTTVSGQYACNFMFNGCRSLTSVDLSSLTTVSGGNGCYDMFYNCTGLTSVDLSSLTTISGYNGCYYMFYNCTGLTSVVLPSLTTVNGGGSCSNMFNNCTNLTSLSFPSITPNSFGSTTNSFGGICFKVPNITLHFPSNTQAKIETLNGYSATAPFGATAGTVLFDLPATYTLTGADSVTYTRNPKYDTATALAWKVGAYGTTNFTPAYYTSGTTDPAVGDTIYSDAACTTAVTTISAIA